MMHLLSTAAASTLLQAVAIWLPGVQWWFSLLEGGSPSQLPSTKQLHSLRATSQRYAQEHEGASCIV